MMKAAIILPAAVSFLCGICEGARGVFELGVEHDEIVSP